MLCAWTRKPRNDSVWLRLEALGDCMAVCETLMTLWSLAALAQRRRLLP
jgi:hypothetical protein